MNPSLLRWRPIGICLLAAVLLHSLALAMLHLQRQRLKPAPASTLSNARPVDDTPELLRFSRHQSERGTPSIVPLPGFDQLPPPPPPSLAASAAGPGGTIKPRGQWDFKPQNSGAGGRSGRGANLAAQQRRASPVRPGAPVSSGQARALAELETPAVLLERLRRLASEAPQPRSVSEPTSGGGPAGGRGGSGEAESPLRRPEGAAQQPFQALWEGAQPETSGPAGVSALPAMLERRSLPLAQARRGGLPINHGEGVLLGDQLLLFWIQGDQLWLLRSKVSGG
jgi:hypothetical protein